MSEPINWDDVFEYRDGNLYWKTRVNPRVREDLRAGSPMNPDNPNGYRVVGYSGKLVLEHRIVWEMHSGAIPKGLVVDHINRIKNDNRIENLRLLTRSGNGINAKVKEDNKSGCSGVNRCKQTGWWRARLRIGNGKRWEKRFRTFEEAVEAQRQKLAEFFPGVRSD